MSQIICTFAYEIIIVSARKNSQLALANINNLFLITNGNAKLIFALSDYSGHSRTK